MSDVLSDMFGSLWKAVGGGRVSPYLESAANFYAYALRRRGDTSAQLYQDLFVLFALNEKRDGYFVELGASDGIQLSNTYLLERAYGWRGILAEPGRIWHPRLKANRRASIDLRYLWSETGKSLEFAEASMPELSTTPSLAEKDRIHAADRILGKTYLVETVSLNDLLASHNAPTEIDYLSVDTEGAELEILQNFDFSKYRLQVITAEHNYRESDRRQMTELLGRHGYVRVFDMMTAWDDWYIHQSILRT